MELNEIKQVIREFKQSPKGVNNCATFASYAAEILPELITEIESLRKRLYEHWTYIQKQSNSSQH